jgi:hypothetical protein
MHFCTCTDYQVQAGEEEKGHGKKGKKKRVRKPFKNNTRPAL